MKDEEFKVFIGKKKAENYIRAANINLNAGKHCILSARGRTISYAVDIAEILIKECMKGTKYGEIKISTDKIKNEDGIVREVSSMEIEIIPPKIFTLK